MCGAAKGETNRIVVSVTMLSYNHEQYIEQALQSVLMQKTNFPIEILVGDDASSDGSRSILRKYAQEDPRIRLFERPENVGTTRNAYLLMTAARGKYLASCESDDYWTDPYKLQKQVDFLEQHPEYIGCSHDILCVDREGQVLPEQRVFWMSDRRVFRAKDFKGIFLPGHSSSILRRNIFLEPKHDYSIFYEAHPLIGDRTAAMLFCSQGDFYRMRDRMSCYRRNFRQSSESITSSVYQEWETRVQEELEFTRKLEAYARDVLGADIHADYYRREMFASALWRYLRNGSERNRYNLRLVAQGLRYPGLCYVLAPYNIAKKFVRKYILRNNR